MNEKRRKPTLSGSILSVPFYKIPDMIRQARDNGLKTLHLDIMDGVFTPQISFGLGFARQIREITDLDLEAHLMVVNPEKYIDENIEGLFTRIFFHYESTLFPLRLISKIKKKDVEAGIAINPSTPVESVKPVLSEVDAILVMLVEPGYGGQKMVYGMLEKVEKLREIREEKRMNFIIACDGGIKIDNAEIVVKKGADELIVGTGIFDSPKFPEIIREFIKLLETTK